MNMDPTYNGYPDFNTILPSSSLFPETPNNYQFNPDINSLSHQFPMPRESIDLVSPASVSKDGEYLYHDGTSLHIQTSVSHKTAGSYDDETVFKFLNKMLMEEELIEPDHIMSYDPLAFRVTERSFYDILGQQYPVTPTTQQSEQPLFADQANQQPLYNDQDAENPEGFSSGSISDVNFSSSPGTRSINLADSQLLTNCREHKLSLLQTLLPVDSVSKYNYRSGSNKQSFVHTRNSRNAFDETISDSIVYRFLAHNIFTDNNSIQQFQRGLEEARKFLPIVNPLVIDLESSKVSADGEGHAPIITATKDTSEMMNSSNKRRGRRNSPNGSAERKKSQNSSRGRKHHEREDGDSDQVRCSKQPAIYKKVEEEEDELSELFDKVLLFKQDNISGTLTKYVDVQNEKSNNSLENGQRQASNGGEKPCAKKQGKKKEIVDLRKLLILCAQALSNNDFKTSTVLLQQIRHHSSPTGDGCERLAHYFANGLEARMVGVGIRPQICYNDIASKQTSLKELKGHQLTLSSSPIKKVLTFYMNAKILEMAENATTLHIIDFGIMYGFQWPILIHKLSTRHGGPPKLRITGIDVPQDGFRPTEWIEDTGRRLANYCARFKVPFEFNAIASQHWESIKVEDLKVERNEILAVNCNLRFKNLMDETVEENSPRDYVLKLIRCLNPNIFVHSIYNGAYSSPYFVPRFREALSFYSSVFDMLDVTMPDGPERLHIERDLFGAVAMNVISCEGADRYERPETYRQWHVRTQRAGLKVMPLDPEITKSYRDMFKEKYHKDFRVEQSGDWLLQGWKGRINCAASCWVPA